MNCESWVSKKSHSIKHPIWGAIYPPQQKITKFTHLNIQKPNNYNFVFVFQSDSFPWKFISSLLIWFWSWTDFCFKLNFVCYLVDLSTFRLKYDASGEQPLEECRRQVCLCFSNQNQLFFASIFIRKGESECGKSNTSLSTSNRKKTISSVKETLVSYKSHLKQKITTFSLSQKNKTYILN